MNCSSEFVSSKYIHLNHCGIQKLWDKDYFMERPNGRADYHILYIYQGACHAELLGTHTVAEKGSMILFKPGEKHKYQFYKSDLPISCYIHFTGVGCENILNDIGFKNERIINIGTSKTILSIFEKMEMEANLKQPFSEELCAGYILEIFAMAGRRLFYSNNKTHLKNKSQIGAVCQFIYDNHTQKLSIETCARQCNLSPGRFAHVFKDTIGKTPLEYINEIRISKAKELRLSQNYTISEISEMVGFPNQNYFSKIFKKMTGVSPKKYSKMIFIDIPL